MTLEELLYRDLIKKKKKTLNPTEALPNKTLLKLADIAKYEAKMFTTL